ncbi:hypothetical protein [Streptomyces sp. NK08204]|uniref:hypothetical protein n=1 Tax=Streptomyces sp. NK08204 TaxID=2873260 RepID=UPI001CECF291|nr:hypothetical protein [Streptomyces sp. NK08204]
MANARRQLRSTTVVLGGMGLLATALTACSSEPDKRCVDQDSYRLAKGYRIIADKYCKSGRSLKFGKSSKSSKSSGSPQINKSLKVSVDAAWYYGGKAKHGWVDGGSFTKPDGGSSGSHDDRHSHHSGVHRGGFGGGHHSSGG